MKKDKGRIVYAYPSSGKTYLGKKYPDRVVDLGRTEYLFCLTEEQRKMDIEERKGKIDAPLNPEWPQNYIDAMLEAQEKYDIVFINQKVLKHLREQNIDYWVVIPRLNDKKEYSERMRKRGNSQEFVEKMEGNFEEYVRGAGEDSYAEKIITLEKGQYLADILDELVPQKTDQEMPILHNNV